MTTPSGALAAKIAMLEMGLSLIAKSADMERTETSNSILARETLTGAMGAEVALRKWVCSKASHTRSCGNTAEDAERLQMTTRGEQSPGRPILICLLKMMSSPLNTD